MSDLVERVQAVLSELVAVRERAEKAEADIAAVRAELKATGHDHEGAPIAALVDRAIDKERTRVEDIRQAVAALEKAAESISPISPLAPAPDADGWIPWRGSVAEGRPCPVAKLVLVLLACGEVREGPVDDFDWRRGEPLRSSRWIIAYRLV
jgi:hypothetical protein